MADDALHRETRDMAVQALEVARQAHERLDRQSRWMETVDARLSEFGRLLGGVGTEVASLKAKVAVGAAIGSLVGGAVVGLVVKLVH